MRRLELNNLKLGVVIVTYNPDENVSLKILKMAKFLDKIVIVDNGSKKEAVIIDEFSDVIVRIRNSTNFGLAKALNIGCEYLYEQGYNYALLLDQDSEIDKTSVEYLKETVVREKCGLVGPQNSIKTW